MKTMPKMNSAKNFFLRNSEYHFNSLTPLNPDNQLVNSLFGITTFGGIWLEWFKEDDEWKRKFSNAPIIDAIDTLVENGDLKYDVGNKDIKRGHIIQIDWGNVSKVKEDPKILSDYILNYLKSIPLYSPESCEISYALSFTMRDNNQSKMYIWLQLNLNGPYEDFQIWRYPISQPTDKPWRLNN